ncbi:MAG: shikimate dehydrogenase [Actinobacteria bacterium]|nr:shikimate dehydrogenase [Actinomycetota bacterium]
MIKAAVLGKPIAHSLSPFVHGQIYQKLGVEYSYERIEHDALSAPAFISQALSSGEWSGFSLTMPLKEVAFSLNLLCDRHSLAAHSVNTLTPGHGFNTDVTGLVRVLEELEIDLEKVVILGSGATARSALVALQELNESGKKVGVVDIFRRSNNGDLLLQKASRLDMRISSLENFSTDRNSHLIISTLPSTAQSGISLQLQGFSGTLFDISYSPWPSTFAGVVKGPVVSGLSLLVAQAVDQAAIFTGVNFDRGEMYREVKLSTARELAK